MPDESEDGSVESIEEQEEGRDVLNVISNLETPGPSKRQRLNAPEKPYLKGTVKRVRVNNFMTYADTVTITPGPRLNLVLGPNGTGKSSLVCALCIGLAGSTKLLGRADNLKDFIRRGCDRAWTEVTLSGGEGGRDVTIKRDISIRRLPDGSRSYSSEWYINGGHKSEKDVKALVADMNIQFDNLCQFLPQDKVVEFARMGPTELLEATEKAIGDGRMYEMHQELIRKRVAVKEAAMSRGVVAQSLERLRDEHEKQRRDWERFRRREELLAEVGDLNRKRCHLELRDAKAALDVTESKLREAVELYEKQSRARKEDDKPLRALRAKAEAAATGALRLQREAKDLDKAVCDTAGRVKKAEEEVQKAESELEGLARESKARSDRIAAARRELVALEADLAAVPSGPPPQVTAKLAALDSKRSSLHEMVGFMEVEVMELQRKVREQEWELANLRQRLAQFRDVRAIRLAALDDFVTRMRNSRYPPNAFSRVAKWVADNRSRFRGQVYGPLLCEVTLRDPSLAAYLETECFNALRMFLTDNEADGQLLRNGFADVLGDRGLIHVGVFTHDTGGAIPHPSGTAAEYRELGILATLDEAFDAPPLVKHSLVDSGNLNRSFVAPPQTSGEQVEAIMQRTGYRVRTVFTSGTKYSLNVSRYNQEGRSYLPSTVGNARLLGSTAGAQDTNSERRAMEASLATEQAKYEALAAELQQKERSLQDVQAQLAAMQNERQELTAQVRSHVTRRKNLESKRKLKQQDLARAEGVADPEARRAQVQARVAASGAKLFEALLASGEALKRQWATLRKAAAAELVHKELEMQAKALAKAQTNMGEAVEKARRIREKMTALAEQERAKFAQAKRRVETEAPLTDELKAAFERLPDSTEEVAAAIAEREAEAEAIVCNNPRVATEFNERAAKIEELAAQVAAAEASLQAMNAEIEEIKADWLPFLRRVVAKINGTFSANFARIGCAGEVSLRESDDYDKFAIEIRVQFRLAEALTVLDASRQSGGERSVSTILYLIALQDVTVTPFRVVDEINQGMDPINERKVFVQLVESACAPDTPQCFLLTPKLLPDLPFTSDITVLTIMNGTQIEAGLPKAFDLQEGLYGMRYGQATGRPSSS